MNLSTRFKFTLLVFSALGMLAAATGVFTAWRVREAISEKLRENSANAVALSAANASDLQENLFLRKIDQVFRLKDLNRLYERTVRAFSGEAGDLFASLRRLALPKGYSILAADGELNVVFRHGDFPDDFTPYRTRDIKGLDVGPTMLRLARENVPAFALIRRELPGGGGVKFFGHHFHLPERGLLVGLWSDIAPQQEEERRGLEKAVATLSRAFAGVRVGVSGFLMAVDGNGEPVIVPANVPAPPDLAAKNRLSGRSLLDDLRNAAETPGAPFIAESPWLGDARQAFFFVRRVRSLGWYVVGVGFVDEIEATGRQLSVALAAAILIIAAGLTLAAALMVGRLTAPLTRLARFAREVSKTDFFREAEGNELLDGLSQRPSRDEIGELARALSFMDGALRARVRELVDAAGKRERMEGELHAATRIQMGFLPGPLADAEVRGRFQLAAELVPAREVGGDLYDFFMLDRNRLCVVIGDVSDKGVPAALFMSMTMILLRSSAETGGGPGDLLARINRNLTRDNVNTMFVTLFVAVADLRTGELRYANGGHNPPHIVSASGIRRIEDASGPLVGVFENAEFPDGKTFLAPGETLFLHTDGVNEAMNWDHEQFGDTALEAALLASAGQNPGETIRRMREAVAAHVAGAPASDDITMLCLRLEKTAGLGKLSVKII
ncbi:MAG: SpoIIE family protein phosphatase [Planctomycetota bacterium]|jgi:sigma-B regulation protein RsbU (phosphoserine phosphatase)|nr:SpoIIE family protein phosphatase [Planctomycetota bacterium]